MTRRLVRLLVLATGFALFAATGQASNQCLSEQDLVDNVNAGVFAWSGSAIAGSSAMVTEARFAAVIANNGSCQGPSTRLMAMSEMQACRQTSTAISATIDPWIVNSADWSTVAGSISYVSGTSAPGAPSGAQSPSGAGTIAQTLNGGASITAGTHITVTAETQAPIATATNNNDCAGGGATYNAQGTYTVEILDGSNNVVTYVRGTTGYWVSTPVGFTVSTSGVYKAAVAVTTGSTSFTTYHLDRFGSCVAGSTQTLTASGNATAITASN